MVYVKTKITKVCYTQSLDSISDENFVYDLLRKLFSRVTYALEEKCCIPTNIQIRIDMKKDGSKKVKHRFKPLCDFSIILDKLLLQSEEQLKDLGVKNLKKISISLECLIDTNQLTEYPVQTDRLPIDEDKNLRDLLESLERRFGKDVVTKGIPSLPKNDH